MTALLIDDAGAAFKSPFGAVLELRPNEGAPVFIDGRSDPPTIAASMPAGKDSADCLWRCPADTMRRAMTSKRAIENAVINGRLSIAGDMSIMARLTLEGK